MANYGSAAGGVWYRPRQCFCQRYDLKSTPLDAGVSIGVCRSASREREQHQQENKSMYGGEGITMEVLTVRFSLPRATMPSRKVCAEFYRLGRRGVRP